MEDRRSEYDLDMELVGEAEDALGLRGHYDLEDEGPVGCPHDRPDDVEVKPVNFDDAERKSIEEVDENFTLE
jgi:hypothetical protein